MMSTHTVIGVTTGSDAARPPRVADAHRGFALGLFVLAAALVVNTTLGPVGTETIEYPISGTLLNQTFGLEVVTVGLVVPLTLVAGMLALRGHRSAPFVGFGAASYTAYMFVQYVLGPEYTAYTTQVLFHTLVFTLSAALTAWAWHLAAKQSLPNLTPRRRRVYAGILFFLAAFILSRYLPILAGGSLPPEFDQARTFFWSIFFLDLGVVAPATLLAGIGLLRGAHPAHTALFALMAWYALVPPSVAAMGTAMVVNNDPHAAAGQAILLSVAAVTFVGLAAWIFLPLLRPSHNVTQPDLTLGSPQ
jgi:hypothetical protein